MDARLTRIDDAIADVIAEEHNLELAYYLAGHENEAQHFVVEIEKLQHLRVLLARVPFTPNVVDTL